MGQFAPDRLCYLLLLAVVPDHVLHQHDQLEELPTNDVWHFRSYRKHLQQHQSDPHAGLHPEPDGNGRLLPSSLVHIIRHVLLRFRRIHSRLGLLDPLVR
jgi:hypothetical protein